MARNCQELFWAMSASLRDSSHLGTSFLLCPTKLLDGHVGLDDAPSEPLLVEQEGGFALEPTKLFAHTCYCTLLPLLQPLRLFSVLT